MKKNVLEIAGMSSRYGIENFLMNILREIDNDVVQLHFLSPTEGPYDDEIRSFGCSIFRIPKLSNPFSHFKSLSKLLKKHPEIDTVHIHGNTAVGCLDALLLKKVGVKRIIVHSHNDSCGSWRGKLLHYISRTLISNCITERLCCSEAAGRWMFGSNNNFTIIPNAIDLNKFKYSKDKACLIRKKYSIQNCRVIGHVGRMEQQKNHLFILKVFQLIFKEHPEARLMLVGNGSLKDSLKITARKLGIESGIIWVDECDNVSDYLSAMDAFLFPSLWEGLGISLVEAQAAGLKCLVSEVIKNEVCVTDLIYKKSLSDSKKEWANNIWDMVRLEYCRINPIIINRLIESKYDIHELGKYMQEFYLDK